MLQLAKTIVIQRPIEEVFDVATCLRRCVVWSAPIVETRMISDGPARVGAEYEHTMSLFGRTFKTNPVITRWDPPRASEYASTKGPMPVRVTFELETVGDSTELTTIYEAEVPNWVREIGAPLLRKMLQRQYEADLETLKELLESRTPVVAPN